MLYTVQHQQQIPASTCLILGVQNGTQLTPSGITLDKQSGGYLTKILQRGDLRTENGSTLLLFDVPQISAERVLLIQCGSSLEDPQAYRKILSKMMAALSQNNIKEAHCYLTELNIPNKNVAWKIQQTIEICGSNCYRFDQLKSKKDPAPALQKISFEIANPEELFLAQQAVNYGEALVAGMNCVKDLGNLPPNICTPTYLAEQALNLSQQFNTIKTTILDEKEMANLGMGSLLSVTKGSTEPAKLITVEYKGADANKRPVVLVGKGVTFDTGGISLKAPPNMDEMKYDMCGGASVLATIKSAALLKLPMNIVAIVPATENCPDSKASKPGDIVKSLSGQTVEILNTDAEGRLILCDALTYAAKFNPEVVIDVATLTGAVIMTFGHIGAGIFSNNDELCHELITAGDNSCDRLWRLPLWNDYDEMINSNFADIANIASHNDAKSIIGATFLARFTKEYKWAHLDVAGTAFQGGKEKGATGRPVPVLLQYLWDRCHK